jgi:hypothetical protein
MDNPHSFNNPAYNPIFDSVMGLQYKYHDITGGNAAGHPVTKAIQNELHQLVQDVAVERSATTLHESQNSVQPAISFDHQSILHNDFEGLKQDVINFKGNKNF